MRGTIAGDWSYDLSGTYWSSLLSEHYLNDVSFTRVQNSLNGCTAPGSTGCVVNEPTDQRRASGGGRRALAGPPKAEAGRRRRKPATSTAPFAILIGPEKGGGPPV